MNNLITLAGIPDSEYFALEEVSSSDLKIYLEYGLLYFLASKFDPSFPKTTTTSMETGTMIHRYILEKDKFWDYYCLFDGKKPTSPNQESFCKYYASTQDLIHSYVSSYNTNNLKIDTVESKAAALYKELEDYIFYLINSVDKIPITQSLLRLCETIYNNIAIYPEIYTPLQHPKTEDWTILAEVAYKFSLDSALEMECPFMFKMKRDLDIVDQKSKTLTYIDLKTTYNARPEEFLSSSFTKYKYGYQAGFYSLGAKLILDNLYSKWKYDSKILAVQTGNYNGTMLYTLSPRVLTMYESRVKDAIKRLIADYNAYNNDPEPFLQKDSRFTINTKDLK